MKTVFVIASLGLIASAIVHMCTFFGMDPQRVQPLLLGLGLLVFVIWILGVVGYLMDGMKQGRGRAVAALLWYTPWWLKALVVSLLAYSLFNFFALFVLNRGGVPSEVNGTEVIHNRGHIIRELTDEEYERHQTYVVRVLSGNLMLLYAAGMAVLAAKTNEDAWSAVKRDS